MRKPLNIKILKFLDDVELYPSYKLRDIFEDIREAKDGERSFSTVKVFRNPPTTAELVDTKRFESLPPESLARPQKRPLPPLFSDSIHNAYPGNIHRLNSPLRRSPTYPDRPNKRQKIRDTSQQPHADPNELLQSLEDTNDCRNLSSVAAHRPSPVHQVEDSQKYRQQKGSDPYGTPVSSQVGVPEGLPSQLADVTSSSHSPPRVTRSTSPEIPLSVDPSPDQETPAQTRSSTQALQADQLAESSQATGTTTSISNLTVAPIPLPVSSEKPPAGSSHVQLPSDISKPASPKPQSTFSGRVGPLPRPKTLKRPSTAKRTRKVINGIPQSTPSVFDPIDTSEGSSKERELLRSAKRPKIKVPPRTQAGSEASRKGIPSKSPRRRFFIPVTPHPVSESTIPRQQASEKNSLSAREQTNSEVFPERHTAIEIAVPIARGNEKSGDTDLGAEKALQRPDQREPKAKPAGSPPGESKLASARTYSDLVSHGNIIPPETQTEDFSASRHADQGNNIQAVEMPGSPSELSTEEVLRRELQEAEEVKRQAQATFDRIAARSAAQKERKERSRKEQEEKKRSANLALSEGVSGVLITPEESDNLPGIPPDHPISAEQPALSGSEATRKYHLEHFLPRVRKQFGLPEPPIQGSKPRVRASTSDKKEKEKSSQPEPKRPLRRTRSRAQKDEAITAEQIVQDDGRAETQSITGQEPNECQIQSTISHSQKEKENLDRSATKPDKQNQTSQVQMQSIKLGEPGPTAESQTSVHSLVEGKQNALKASERQIEKPLTQKHDAAPTTNRVEVDKLTSADAPPQSSDFIGAEGTAVAKATPVVFKQGGLGERSPKARLNAERQIQLANQYLKNKKAGSTQVGSYDSKVVLSGVDAHTPVLGGSQIRPSVKKPATGRSSGSREPDQTASVAPTRFTDHDALKAAGIDTGKPSSSVTSTNAGPSTARPGILKKSSIIDLTGQDSARSSSAQEHRSSKQPDDGTSSESVRTMTPAIPSTSMKSDPKSAEVKAVSAQRAASAVARLSKTPMRSALRTTPNVLRRSVSFATEPTNASQPMSSDPTPAIQVPPKGKGMFYRALEEDANKLKSLAQTSAAGKTKGRPLKTKQTKLTHHIRRDLQQKGKEVIRPVPRSSQAVDTISLSSASEASTFFSDESEGTRNSRAGPSSRKRGKSRSTLATGSNSIRLSQPHSSVSHGLSNDEGDGFRMSAMAVKKEGAGEVAEVRGLSKVPTAKVSSAASRASIARQSSALAPHRLSKPSPPQSISDASSDSDAESHDSLSLLPTVPAKGKMLKAGPIHQSDPKAAYISVKPAKVNGAASMLQVPRTPKEQTEDSKAARLAKEKQRGIEAEQQLLREHNQAMQAAASTTGKHEVKTKKGGIGFEVSSLSKLREAQRAQPMVTQRAKVSDLTSNKRVQSALEDWTSSSGSSNESSSSASDSLEPARLEAKLRQKSTASKPKGLTKALKELFGGRP
ncbi:MAG: hypothetical protein Q9228_003706 [Teloschistes exilis]